MARDVDRPRLVLVFLMILGRVGRDYGLSHDHSKCRQGSSMTLVISRAQPGRQDSPGRRPVLPGPGEAAESGPWACRLPTACARLRRIRPPRRAARSPRLVGVGDVVQDAQQHERDRAGEVEGPRRLGKDIRPPCHQPPGRRRSCPCRPASSSRSGLSATPSAGPNRGITAGQSCRAAGRQGPSACVVDAGPGDGTGDGRRLLA